MSPYLFVIAAEILAEAVRSNKQIEGITLHKQVHKISQYADDTTLITKANENSIRNCMNMLGEFERCSGLKINKEKTKVAKIGGWGDSSSNLCEDLALDWIMTKEEIERSKNVTLNFLEYMSIKQSIKGFIKNAKKQIENTGPYRPYLLNIVFSEKKGCQNIYRKTGQYGNKILNEISQKWDIDLLQNIEAEEVKQSIRTFKKTTRNMYLWDIQYKIWFGRVATNSRLFLMNIKESDNCEFCQQIETNVHAFILCERAQNPWSDITTFLTEIGYRNFRLEHQILIFGDTEMDPLFNIIIIIAKKLIYQNRGKGNNYSLIHFKALLEMERESEELYANENDKIEQYERRWEKYLTIY